MIHKNDQKGILRAQIQLGNFRFHKLRSTRTHTHLAHTHTQHRYRHPAHIQIPSAHTHTPSIHTLSTHSAYTHTQHAHTHTHTQQTKNFSILFKLSVMFLGWGLPFLYMRRKHAVVTEQIDFRFLKTLASTELVIFLLRICVYNERFCCKYVKCEGTTKVENYYCRKWSAACLQSHVTCCFLHLTAVVILSASLVLWALACKCHWQTPQLKMPISLNYTSSKFFLPFLQSDFLQQNLGPAS